MSAPAAAPTTPGPNLAARGGWRRAAGHLLAVCALVGVAYVVHHDDVFALGPHFDERIFGRAFTAVNQGESPYLEPTFNYPPPFALLGAWLWARLGERGFLLLVRQLELISVAAIAWLAVVRARWPAWVRWGVAAGAVAWAFPVENALFCGNVSPIIALLTLGGLALVPAAPWIGGALLGTGVALKPIAAAAVALLAVLGFPRRDAWWRAALAAGATAAALCLLLGARFLPAMWQRASVPAPPEQDLALARGLRAFGFAPSAPGLFLVVTALAAVLLLRRARRHGAEESSAARRDLEAIVITACMFSLPVLWPHTLLLSLPVQVLAIERGLADRRPPLWRALVLALLVAAVVSIDGRSGSGVAPAQWPEPWRGALALIPLAALGLLTASALRHRAERDDTRR